MLSKDIIRKKMLVQRDSMPVTEVDRKSEKLGLLLKKFSPFLGTKRFGTYAAVRSEASVNEVMQELFDQKIVAYPRMDSSNKILSFHQIEKWGDLQEGKYALLEPNEQCPKISLNDLTLMLVPGIAFDEKGNRIGYGRGHYDYTLEKTAVMKIGLAFESQLIESVPIKEHDIPMDFIITEERIIDCRKIRGIN